MSANDRDAHWADQPTEDLPIFPPGSASSTRAGNDNFSSGPAGKTPLTAPGSASETHADLTSYTDWSRGVPTGHTQGTSGATQFFESPGRAGYQDLGPDIRHDEQETEDLPPLDEIYAAQRGGTLAGRDGNVGGPAYVGGAHTGGGYQSGQGNTGATPPTTDANPHAAMTAPYGTYAEATEVLGGTAPGTPASTRNADYVDPTPSGAINTGHFQPVDATEVMAAPPVAHPGGPDATQVLGGEYAPT
ncbi:MAG: hypothetical protein Q4C87_11310, partial [Actinomycetaceae bacterium]|nr:hypothetical protein [Actinomycetaceae bacterium]